MDIKALELATLAMDPTAEDALYYRITDHAVYGTWAGGDAMLVDRRSLSNRQIARGVTKTAADMANGRVNFNLSFVPKQVRTEASRLVKLGLLERCAYGTPSQPLKIYDHHFVYTAKWAVTGRCNFKCRHCFLSAPDAHFGELPTADCKRLIREMAEVGVQKVQLTGGEPLVRQDLFELIDEILSQGIQVSAIATNGALVNDSLLDELEIRGLKPKFYMSFDGVGWHDWLRGIDGAEKMLMGKFELLAKRGYDTGSAFSMHKGNAPVLRQTINRLADVGAKHAIINRMLDFGEWHKYGRDFNISHKEVFETYLDYLPHFFEDGMPIKVSLNRMITLSAKRYDYEISAIHSDTDCGQKRICPAVFRTLFITADGKLAPCISIAGREGQQKNFADLSRMSLRDAMENSAYAACAYQTVSDYFARNPECAACEYRLYCQGGCRSQALEFDENDYMGIDRHRCEFFRGQYTERILQRLKETVPEAHCTNIPEDFPLKPLAPC